VADAINSFFEDFEQFRQAFFNAPALLFGSGWAWLVWNRGELQITTTTNQDNPPEPGKITDFRHRHVNCCPV
jgi:Fe-Mn family superoxide dismutase